MARPLPSKLNRAQQKHKTTMAKFGITEKDDEFWEVWDAEKLGETDEPKITRSAAIIAEEFARNREREAELVLSALYGLDTIRVRNCKQCNSEFGTNYNYERYCSNTCRQAALAGRGITWSIDKTEDQRWRGQAPSTIAPQTLVQLKAWARRLLEGFPESPDNGPAPVETLRGELIPDGVADGIVVARPTKKFDWL